MNKDFFDVTAYHYDLPKELIAQEPCFPRDHCRLLVLDKEDGFMEHCRFDALLRYLRPGDLLIRNDTRVMASRLFGVKKSSGAARVEVLLLRQNSEAPHCWEALVHPGRRLKPGTTVILPDGLEVQIGARLSDDGVREVLFPPELDVRAFCEHHGEMPLPPYITSRASSSEDYQTVYARETGSAAAPTAGLHFTPRLLDELLNQGISIADVTLEVGLGTFRPVIVSDLRDHVMHSERCHVPPSTLDAIARTKADGGRVIAVGTTVVRTLEGLWCSGDIASRWFETNMFIYPGYRFNIVDGLLTNFHLPGSTLLMLVSAFAGYESTMTAYQTAVDQLYRFFSFGDAMLILKR